MKILHGVGVPEIALRDFVRRYEQSGFAETNCESAKADSRACFERARTLLEDLAKRDRETIGPRLPEAEALLAKALEPDNAKRDFEYAIDLDYFKSLIPEMYLAVMRAPGTAFEVKLPPEFAFHYWQKQFTNAEYLLPMSLEGQVLYSGKLHAPSGFHLVSYLMPAEVESVLANTPTERDLPLERFDEWLATRRMKSGGSFVSIKDPVKREAEYRRAMREYSDALDRILDGLRLIASRGLAYLAYIWDATPYE